MKTVRVILNAHLDPVWLWPWQAGLDAALATCRSACDMLDRNPNVYFTQGEAWVHREVERADRHALQFHRPPVIADLTRGMRR